MIEFYPEIRLVHIVCVIASGTLFAIRGLAHFSGAIRAANAVMRYTSYSIDVALLTTAMMLATILGQYPFVHGWLTAKVLLLLVYIALGYCALWRAKNRALGIALWAAALAVYLFIVSIARAHQPFGFLTRWLT